MIVEELAVADSGAHERGISLTERKHIQPDPLVQHGARLEFGNYLLELGVPTRCIRQCCILSAEVRVFLTLESVFCEWTRWLGARCASEQRDLPRRPKRYGSMHRRGGRTRARTPSSPRFSTSSGTRLWMARS